MYRNDYPTETLEVEISHIDEKGWGVARYIHPPDRGSNGKRLNLQIPFTVPGDIVQVTVENAKGRGKAVVEFDELIKAGPTRNLAIDPKAEFTGGTPLIAMDYAAQLAHKETLVKEHLANNGFSPTIVQPIIGMSEPTRYRNKMELTFGVNGELGMFQQGNYRKVIDFEDTILAPEVMIAIKHRVNQWRLRHHLSAYDQVAKVGLLRNLLLRKSFATQEVMVVIVATEGPAAYQSLLDEIVTELSVQFPAIQSIMWTENTGMTRSTEEDETHLLYGRDFIYDELGGYRYRIWQDTFFQPNPQQAEVMVESALALAGDVTGQRVVDLYCGIGTFSLPFAARAEALAGIEIVESSIISAKRNAADNGLDNTYFVAVDARKGLANLRETWGEPDLLVLDPPRSGAGGKMMRAIGRLGLERIIYISCSPKALAEDLVWLRDFGYEVKVVQPIDQFPHTAHVETVVLIEKSSEGKN